MNEDSLKIQFTSTNGSKFYTIEREGDVILFVDERTNFSAMTKIKGKEAFESSMIVV